MRAPLFLALLLASPAAAQAPNTSAPSATVKLVFVHHSTGENWLRDDNGGLGIALRDANYFVSDTNYGWGPADADAGYETIGDHTDIGHWYLWFAGPHRDAYLAALYAESGQHAEYARRAGDPGGTNRVVMIKSCFPNARLTGPAGPIPPIGSNPLRGESASSDAMTVANAKGIYVEILKYFASRQDVLYVVVVNPPLGSFETDAETGANARLLADWLVNDWLKGYAGRNVFVFDFFNVLTSNGGSTRTNDPDTNDLGWSDGNHHRVRNAAYEHVRTVAHDMSAYATGGDSHPTGAGNAKATGEFVPLLNAAYHCWQGDGACATSSTSSCTITSCAAQGPAGGTAGLPVSFSATVASSGCTGSATYDWNFGDGSAHGTSATVSHTYTEANT